MSKSITMMFIASNQKKERVFRFRLEKTYERLQKNMQLK